MEIQALYQQAIKFATIKHLEENQNVPGSDMPYVVHLSNVAMEILIAGQNTEDFDLSFAVQVALLHDTLEDTATTVEELTNNFGGKIAEGVVALTKNESLLKKDKMQDSLNRIKANRMEVWAVKLADRITNLQAPPSHWDNAKRKSYQIEAIEILNTLKGGNVYLEERLAKKIEEYSQFIKVE